ncbi:zinc finger protein 135-like [Cydia fagiglandana]|uniref:zinc finger protein 135-like n=1 Tax=Cydia fagiglandana TaxID=1458189 RepID=UPI002FEE17F8
MESSNECHCCLLRPAARDMMTPYSCLGITETYSVMLQACFLIDLIPGSDGKSGICEACVERLRDACHFKMLVQRSQAKLQERLEREQSVKGLMEMAIEDAARDVVLLHVDDESVGLTHGDGIYHEPSHIEGPGFQPTEGELCAEPCLHTGLDECSVKSETSGDAAGYGDVRGCPTAPPAESGAQSIQEGMCDEPCLHEEFTVKSETSGNAASGGDCPSVPMEESALPPAEGACVDPSSHEACSVKSEASGDEASGGDGRTVPLEEPGFPQPIAEERPVKPEVSGDAATDEDCPPVLLGESGLPPTVDECSMKSESGDESDEDCLILAPSADACGARTSLPARANEQLEMACCVRLERLRDSPRASQPRPATPHRAPSPARSVQDAPHTPAAGADPQPYTCDTCQTHFTDKSTLITHIQEHMKQSDKSNKTCFKKDLCKNSFTENLQINTDTITYSCDMCSEQFTSKSLLIQHIEVHNDQKRLELIKQRSMNAVKNMPDGEKTYRCEECKKQLSHKSSLYFHIKTHSKVKPFKCKECDKRFPDKRSLKYHERIHVPSKLYVCKVCNKQYTNIASFKNHEKIHSTPKPYICKECNKRFQYKTLLAQHESIHTGVKQYQCKECKKRFGFKTSLDRHEKIHKGLKPYTCKECNKQFTQKVDLQSHEKIHSGRKPYKCKECNKKFLHKHHLEVHERFHSGLKPYACIECDKRFTTIGEITKHELVHNGLRPYKCKECNKQYKQKHALDHHVESRHGDKPYKCKECNKRFETKSRLRGHKGTHSGLKQNIQTRKKPYTCKICETIFLHETSLIKHIEIHNDPVRRDDQIDQFEKEKIGDNLT